MDFADRLRSLDPRPPFDAPLADGFQLDRLTVEDLEEVVEIERASFSDPWSPDSFVREFMNARAVALGIWTTVIPKALSSPASSGLPPEALAVAQSLRQNPWAVLGAAPWELDPQMRAFLEAHRDSEEIADDALRTPRGLAAFLFYWVILDEYHIMSIATHPAQRGRGLGRALLEQVRLHAMARGGGYVHLEVRVSNATAIHLYESMGFRPLGVRRDYYLDNGEDALMMEWIVGEPPPRMPPDPPKIKRRAKAPDGG